MQLLGAVLIIFQTYTLLGLNIKNQNGKGLGLLSEGLAMAIIAVFSLAIFALALKLRLLDEQARIVVSKEYC